jgi:glycine/D-amino acid oxidase-like deaminating enzyme/nitrite reductase/ring-hydroxylating ferredoxin subunit
MPNYTNSLWSETAPTSRYPAPAGDATYDVAVIGGGITGLTTASLLQREGRRVAVLESRRIGKGETGKTTAHLTEALDTRYHVLVSRFGAEGARLGAEGQRAAIERIARFVEELAIVCDFRRVPGYLYAERPQDKDQLEREHEAAGRAGVAATLTTSVPLPFPTALGLCFPNQATFHPRLYLQALAEAFVAAGGTIHEETHVSEVQEGEPCRVITDRAVVSAPAVVVAAHVPIINRFFLITKLGAYRTYALGVELPFPTDALFWDLGDPYHYTRPQQIDGRQFLIVGGEDHKVGEAPDTTIPFSRLEAYVRARYHYEPAATDYRWSGQIIESADGLPYVGHNALSGRVFVATGYGGNGMTNGTLAAMVLADQVCGRRSRFGELLDATRIKPLASAKAFVAENVDFPKHLLKDRLPRPGSAELARLPPGEGEVLSLGGRRLAVYRNANGELSALAPECTHLGCLVHWNSTEKSWDCPCHGSRFDPHGRVLNGPAVTPLRAQPLPFPQAETEQRAEAEAARAEAERAEPEPPGPR